jgi:hypothetical protein
MFAFEYLATSMKNNLEIFNSFSRKFYQLFFGVINAFTKISHFKITLKIVYMK